MNLHRHPELLDRLAAEYALGTMHGGARRRFQALMRQHVVVTQAVARWDERLTPMTAQLPELAPGDAMWSRIEQRAFGGSSPAAPASPPLQRSAATADRRAAPPSWWQRLFAPLPAGALAFGLMLGVAAPTVFQLLRADGYDAQLPESYVGVLATADGRQGLIVSSLRRGRALDLKVIQAVPVPAGSVAVLWTLDAQGRPQAVGPLPPLPAGGFVSVALPRVADELFARAVELAVSVEPAGSLPAQPGSAYVYRGLCGKLWKLPPAR